MRIWLVLAGTLVLAVAAFFKLQRADLPAQQLQISAVEHADVAAAVFISGEVQFARQARLSAEVVAKVSDILVQAGQAVQAGQLLMRLDDTEINKEIDQATFAVERAQIQARSAARLAQLKQQDVKRLQRLAGSRFVQKELLEQAQGEWDLAAIAVDAATNELRQRETALALAQSKAAKTRIRAPFAGVVLSIPIKVGETALPSVQSISGSELMLLADPASYQLRALISEFDIGRVRPQQAVNVVLRSKPGLTMRGQVLQVGHVLQSANQDSSGGAGGIEVLIGFEHQTGPLISGLNADIEVLQSAQAATLTVPVGAIHTVHQSASQRYVKGELTSHYVFVVQQDVIEQRAVQLGLADGSRQEVLKGLQAGEQVIAGPAVLLPQLKNGMRLADLPAGFIPAGFMPASSIPADTARTGSAAAAGR